ncbi:hypothetical protein LCGC14_3008330, partial [marine sediment metagenome]
LIIILFLFSFLSADYYKGKEAYKIWHNEIIKKAEKRERQEEILGYLMGIPLFGALITGIIYSAVSTQRLKQRKP